MIIKLLAWSVLALVAHQKWGKQAEPILSPEDAFRNMKITSFLDPKTQEAVKESGSIHPRHMRRLDRESAPPKIELSGFNESQGRDNLDGQYKWSCKPTFAR